MKGLYVHVPFCTKKCSYCDFVSFGGRLASLPSYLSALRKEAEKYSGEKIDTVYFGGGTPSLIPEDEFASFMEFLRKNFEISENAEITVECNPQSVTLQKMKTYASCGVTRVSIGAQSLSDEVLGQIGRCHTVAELENAIECAGRAGIENFNLDLIFALPGQTLEKWQNTVRKVLEYKPKHVSCYSLTLSDKTPMGKMAQRGEISLPDEETEREMYRYLVRALAENGINQYEISNFAFPGYECRHNINYWSCGEYIGLGCAAHSYYNGSRYRNTEDLDEFISGKFEKFDEEILSLQDKKTERIMLGLRMNDGMDTAKFDFDFASDFFSEFSSAMERCKDFIFVQNKKICLNERGRDVADSVILEFVSDL